MFSPAINDGGPAKGTRSNRRRQRPLSSDSLAQQPKAKRQRLPLTETTFVNPDVPPEMFEVKPSQDDSRGLRRDGIENFTAPRRELSVRSKKPKAGERLSKGDGSVVLTSNSAYTVSKLPALPDRVRADKTSRQHGAIYPSAGFGLNLTHTHAFVWPYTATTTSPETFVFTLPYPARLATEPLPLGALVSPAATSEEPGLVVVMPVSGKVSYWESISAAATLDFLQKQRAGIEDSIHGMFSGEFVTDIVNAEPAGFVLAFSSGRLAYMSVRDGQGRPAISTQYLRGGLSSNTVGLFGSIRQVLSHSTYRGDIVSVKSNPSSGKASERIVVAAMAKGKFQAWRIHRGGRHDNLLELDARSAIQNALTSTGLVSESSSDSFELVDFAFVPHDLDRKHIEMSALSDAIRSQDDARPHLLLLISTNTKRNRQYALVEVQLSPDGVTGGLVRPVTTYAGPVSSTATARPRLYLPRPALVAFVVFERTVVISSLASTPLLPEYQLQAESQVATLAFEDAIDFRDREGYGIVGSGAEEPLIPGSGAEELRGHRHKTRNPAAVLLVQGVGVVRVSVSDVERFGSEQPPQVTAKSKLEQAVFFGVKADNPLQFGGRQELRFTNKEIGQAALDLSHDILSSRTSHISSLPASLDGNIRTRQSYLDKLISHLNALHVDLELQHRYKLSDDAEKMAAAGWMWRRHEQFLAERAKDNKKSIISDIACYIHEQQKAEPNFAIGEVDRVRHWFINDIWRLDIFVAWAYEVVKYNFKDQLLEESGLNRLLYEAVVVSNGVMEQAFEFREAHAADYGLPANDDRRPEPWTSSVLIQNSFKRLIEFCYQWLDLYYPPSPEKIGTPDSVRVGTIRDSLPPLTGSYLRVLSEAFTSAARSDDPQVLQMGDVARKQFFTDRYEKVLKLKDYKLYDQAVELAQECGSFTAMAEVMVDEIKDLKDRAADATLPAKEINTLQGLASVEEQKMGEYFEKIGEEFAFPAYDVLLRMGGIQAVLDFPCDRRGYATKFLRTKPELAKISWINDVEREKNIEHAADTLLDLGLTREQQVWNKKIELSLGKLALLAEAEEKPASGQTKTVSETGVAKERKLKMADQALEVIDIQDRLYKQILPTISLALDQDAELQLVVETHAIKIPKKHRVLHQVFEDAMSRLLKHEVLDARSLIDLLTLVWLRPEHVDSIRDQFYLALRVAEATLEGDGLEMARRLIWRRCYTRDDWKAVNDTVSKDDQDQLDVIGQTVTYSAMWSVVEYHKREQSFYPIVKPSEALGVYTEDLDPRFDNMEQSYRSRLLEAMKAEDTKLRAFIEKAQLDKWYRAILEAAEITVAKSLDEQTADGAAGTSNGVGGDNGKVNGHVLVLPDGEVVGDL